MKTKAISLKKQCNDMPLARMALSKHTVEIILMVRDFPKREETKNVPR